MIQGTLSYTEIGTTSSFVLTLLTTPGSTAQRIGTAIPAADGD